MTNTHLNEIVCPACGPDRDFREGNIAILHMLVTQANGNVGEWDLIRRDGEPKETSTYFDYLPGPVEKVAPAEDKGMCKFNPVGANPAAPKVWDFYPSDLHWPLGLLMPLPPGGDTRVMVFVNDVNIWGLGHSPHALAHLRREGQSASLKNGRRKHDMNAHLEPATHPHVAQLAERFEAPFIA